MRRVARIVTPAATTPVSLAEIKAHCRITFDDDDVILGVYLDTAISIIEQILQRKLINQTWKMWLDRWPAFHISTLFGDLKSVTGVKYTDDDGAQSTLDSSVYDVDTNSVPGRIVLKDGESWPSETLNKVNPIEVEFVTGYGTAASDVPPPIRNAIMLTTSHFYENRENLIVDKFTVSVESIPWTSQALLSPYRVWEWSI